MKNTKLSTEGLLQLPVEQVSILVNFKLCDSIFNKVFNFLSLILSIPKRYGFVAKLIATITIKKITQPYIVFGTVIFEPFISTKPNGLGLGLTYAKNIIEAHGGQISILNVENGEVPLNKKAF
jgi:hypothetical protein